MHVVFRNIRQLEIHDLRKLIDIETASGDIGGHQDRDRSLLEAAQGARAGTLALVAMDGHRRNAIALQALGQAIGPVLGPGEHQHLTPLLRSNQMRKQPRFRRPIDQMNGLLDQFGRGVARRHRDLARRVEEPMRERADFLGKSCREEQILALGRQQGQDPADIANEPHIEHAIGFIEDENFNPRQVQGSLTDVVQQTTGRGDQNVQSFAQGVDLRLHTDPTKHHHRAHWQVLAVGADRLLDLRGQFSGRGQNQAPWPADR